MNGQGTQPHILCNLAPNFHRIAGHDEPARIKLHLQKLYSIQVPSTEEQYNNFINFTYASFNPCASKCSKLAHHIYFCIFSHYNNQSMSDSI